MLNLLYVFIIILISPAVALAQQTTSGILTMDFEEHRGIALRAGLLINEDTDHGETDAENALRLSSPLTIQAHPRNGPLHAPLSQQQRVRIGNFVLRLKHDQQRRQALEGTLVLAYGVLAGPRPGVLNFHVPGLDFTGYAPAQDNRVRNLPSNDTLPMGSFLTGRNLDSQGRPGTLYLFAWTLPVGNGGTAGIRADFFERLRISGRAVLARQLSLLIQTEGSLVRVPIGNNIYLVAVTRIAGRLELLDSPMSAMLAAASLQAGPGIEGQWGETRGHVRVLAGPELLAQPQQPVLAPILNITADVDL